MNKLDVAKSLVNHFINEFNQLSKLHFSSILFFVASIKNDSGEDLLEVFDNFHSCARGIVEEDIWKLINMQKSDTIYLEKFSEINLSKEDEAIIKNRLDYCKIKYPQLFKMSVFELIYIHHKTHCWNFYYDMYRKLNKSHIYTNLIRVENLNIINKKSNEQ